MVFLKLREARLRINANKLSFCAITTEYLGYTLTRERIKPQTNKVQVILALIAPTHVKELS